MPEGYRGPVTRVGSPAGNAVWGGQQSVIPQTIDWGIPPPILDGHTTGQQAASTTVEKVFSAGSTSLGAVLPVVYGTRRVAGTCACVYTEGATNTIWVAFLLCQGEVSSITSVEVNGTAVTSLSWVTTSQTHVGSLTQTVDTLLSGGLPDWVEEWPGYAYVVLEIDGDNAECPGSLALTALVAGRKISDFRTGGAAALNNNPVCIAYDILTATDCWGGSVATAAIDTTTWTAVADWCDAAMGDSSKRWTFDGILTDRDPWGAAQEVLDHCFAKIVAYQDKLYLWAERAQTASGVAITADRIVGPVRDSEVPETTWPDVVRVKYSASSSTFDTTHLDAEISGGAPATTLKRTEASLSGCCTASMAARWGQTELLRCRSQWMIYELTAGRQAADLLPGDTCTIEPYEGAAAITVRVERIEDLKDGTYRLRCRNYSTTPHVTTTATSDSIVSRGAGIVAERSTRVDVSTTNFGGILDSGDDTLQEALDAIDDHNHDSAYVNVSGDTMTGALTLTEIISDGGPKTVTTSVEADLFKLTLGAAGADGGLLEIQVEVLATGLMQSLFDLCKFAWGYDGSTTYLGTPEVVSSKTRLSAGKLTTAYRVSKISDGVMGVHITVTTSEDADTIKVNWRLSHVKGTYAAL